MQNPQAQNKKTEVPYPVTVHYPVKNPAQEDDDNIRMAEMLKKLMDDKKDLT